MTAAVSPFNSKNATIDNHSWKGAGTAFIIVLFTTVPLMITLVSLLICKLYGLRRIVAPVNSLAGIETPTITSPEN